MRITLTIDVEDGNIAVFNKAQEPVTQQTTKEEITVPQIGNKQFGEKLPKGRYAARVRPRTEEYPFNVGDAKEEMDKEHVTMHELANCLGIDTPRLRNIFRYDTRRFTRKDYDVILKAIAQIKQQKEI